MNLLLLYGPPAVGKLTIAKELERKTRYKLFHNHMLLNLLSEIFGFNHPTRKKLEIEFYFRIIEEIVKADINITITSCKVGQERNIFYAKLIQIVEDNGGNCFLVQLTAPKETLLNRVEDESRTKNHKIIEKEHLERFFKEHPEVFDTIPTKEQLVLNTAELAPDEAAGKIVKYFKLI